MSNRTEYHTYAAQIAAEQAEFMADAPARVECELCGNADGPLVYQGCDRGISFVPPRDRRYRCDVACEAA